MLTHRHRANPWFSEGRGRVNTGVGESEAQTTVYKINKLQGSIVQHRE